MSAPMNGAPALDAIIAALATVQDPEINRPLTELGMVKDVQIGAGGAVRVEVYLTVSGCPMRETITNRVTTAVSAVPGVTSVAVGLDVMSDEQRAELRRTRRGDIGGPGRSAPSHRRGPRARRAPQLTGCGREPPPIPAVQWQGSPHAQVDPVVRTPAGSPVEGDRTPR